MSINNQVENSVKEYDVNIKDSFIILGVVAFVTSISNWAGTGNNPIESFTGMLILCAMICTGIVLKKIIPIGFPLVAWVSLVSVALTLPINPFAEIILKQLKTLNFLSLVTPVLAYAALSVTKMEVDLFKKSGVKIVIISILVFTGTYIGSAIIANAIISYTG